MLLRALCVAVGLVTAASSANAAGFFFFLPIGAIQNAVQGGHCVPATAKAGDQINVGGKLWVIKETNGESSRCSQYPNWPVIAKLEPYVSEAELAAEVDTCLPMGAAEGATTTLPGLGEVRIRKINSTDCTDMRNPVSARVVRVRYATAPQPSAPPPVEVVKPAPVQEPKPALQPVVAPSPQEPPKMVTTGSLPPTQQKSIADRLRELKQLRDENLITEAVYEAKQKEILSGQ